VSTPDTPDYQRGVVSAQQLLATVAAGTAEVTVDVPPNAETLIVCVQEYPSSLFIRAVGVTTGVVYPTAFCSTGDGIVTWQAQFFDCSSPLDSKVQITCATAPSQPWYVYSDAAVHVVIDPISANAIGGTGAANPGGTVQVGGTDGTDLRTLRTSEQGLPYAIPSPPGIDTGDRPPVELTWLTTTGLTVSTNVLSSPGAGKRYRLFYVNPFVEDAAGACYVEFYAAYGGLVILGYPGATAGVGVPPITLPLVGLPVLADGGLTLTVAGGTCGITLGYTVETV